LELDDFGWVGELLSFESEVADDLLFEVAAAICVELL